MTKKQHLLPLVLTFAILAGIIVLTQLQVQFTAYGVTMVVLAYFVLNVGYSLHQKTFSLKRLVEIGLIAVIAQYTALSFII